MKDDQKPSRRLPPKPEEGPNQRRINLITTAVLCAITAVGLIGAGVYVFNRNQAPAKASDIPGPPPPSIEISQEQLIEDSEDNFRALKVAEAFCEASTLEEILPLVHNGQQHREAIAAHLKHREATFLDIKKSNFRVFQGQRFHLLKANIDGTLHHVHVPIQGPAKLKVDWDVFSGTNPIDFDEVPSHLTNSEEATLRCHLSRPGASGYYNYSFTESDWNAYYLNWPHSDEHVLWGYARKNSPIDKQLAHLLSAARSAGDPLVRATFKLKSSSPAEAKGRQFEITEITSPTWHLSN